MYKIWIKSKERPQNTPHYNDFNWRCNRGWFVCWKWCSCTFGRKGSIVSYALAGLLVIFVMRMLGEMATVNPTSGSFATYAREAIGVGGLYNRLVILVFGIVIAIEATAGAGIINIGFHKYRFGY